MLRAALLALALTLSAVPVAAGTIGDAVAASRVIFYALEILAGNRLVGSDQGISRV